MCYLVQGIKIVYDWCSDMGKKMKMKTKSSVKGRFKIDSKGRVRRTMAGHRHNLAKRSARFIRNNKGYGEVSAADAPRIKRYMMPNN